MILLHALIMFLLSVFPACPTEDSHNCYWHSKSTGVTHVNYGAVPDSDGLYDDDAGFNISW